MKKDILKILKNIKKNDMDKSLFYSWDKLPMYIQKHFCEWCKEYMEVSHEECFGGWGYGWSKYHERYIDFLNNEQKFLQELGRIK